MNNLKLISILKKFVLVVAISTVTISTGFAQITWDWQASNCDHKGKHSYTVIIKNNTNENANYKVNMLSFSGSAFNQSSENVFIKVNETKSILLNDIPAGYYQVIVLRNNENYKSRYSFFKKCFEIVWDKKPSNCDEHNKRSIGVAVTNNTHQGSNHVIEIYEPNADKFIHGSHKVYINANETKTILLNGIPSGYFSVKILNEYIGDFLATKRFNFKPCFKDNLVWDDQPSACDNFNNRSIGVTVKNNNFYDAKFKIEVYNGNNLIRSSQLVPINKYETKRLTLGGIPTLNPDDEYEPYKVIVKRSSKKYAERYYTFYKCEDFEEETLNWISKPSACSGSIFREVEVEITNNSNIEQKYQLSIDGANTSNNLITRTSDVVLIAPNITKKVKLKFIDYSKFILTLWRNTEQIFSESIQLNNCDLIIPDNINWDNKPTGCDAFKKHSIGVLVKNNGDETNEYRVDAYNYDYASDTIKGVPLSLEIGSEKRLNLHNVDPGNYRVVVTKKDSETNEYNVVSSQNYNFMPCGNTSNLRQKKAFQPFFTEMKTSSEVEASFSVNLKEYFESSTCSNINYRVRKLSPGTTQELSGSILTIEPTTSFLGKSFFEITASCGTEDIVSLITVHIQPSLDLFNNCNTEIVNIGAMNYNPLMDNNKLLHETYSWRDPMLLAEQYIEELTLASGNYIYFNVTKWININDFPTIYGWQDNDDDNDHDHNHDHDNDDNNNNERTKYSFEYTIDTYKELLTQIKLLEEQIRQAESDERTELEAQKKALVDKSESFDYVKNLKEQGMPAMVNQKLIDEVWTFGGGYFRGSESCMAGPGAYAINGNGFNQVKTNGPFAIMSFSYKENLGNMLHNNGHRAAAHIKRAYDITRNEIHPESNWDRFTANVFKVDPGWLDIDGNDIGVGGIHYPPNARYEYDYTNDEEIGTTALDYVKYPKLEGKITEICQETWGTVWQESFLKWWFSLLPKADGINYDGRWPDGRVNNWWKYVYDFNSYDSKGKSHNTIYEIPKDFPTQYAPQGIGKKYILNLDDYVIDRDVALPQFRILSSNNIPIVQEGSKLYAYVPTNNKTSTLCSIKICDGDYSIMRQFYIFFDDTKCATNPNCEVDDNLKTKPTTSLESNNFPNPFSQQTTITYTLPQSSNVSIKVYNSAGKQIEVLADNNTQQQGTHQINFDGTTYPSGIYYYSIQNGEHFNMHKMVLMKE